MRVNISGNAAEGDMMGSGEKQPRELTGLAYQELQKGDYRKAVGYFKNAAEKARDVGDVNTMISSYLNAGACLVSRGKLEEGNKLLLSSLKLVKAEDVSGESDEHDPAMAEIGADIYYNLAVAAQKMDNKKRATACFKMSMELYLKSECKARAAESITGLARCHRQAGQCDNEITCLVTAQQLYHEVGESFHEAEACLELARTYLRESRMEDCKRMLSTAKLLCLRTHDHRGLQGKLYAQFGIIYSSMGLYDLGIQNFERALPLVRESIETKASLQAEASLLQNIGAAYNEQAQYLEATVFHKEAAAIHGKVGNYNSESKSLCNLAFAQTQLKQFEEAAKTFSNALAKAHLAKNDYLQFQTCEGLGSTHHQMGRFDEAASYYQQALTILDQIREDTGIARERVMEKLSQASESLQRAKVTWNREGEDTSLSSNEEQAARNKEQIGDDSELPSPEEAHRNFRESVFGEGSHDPNPISPISSTESEPAKKISLTERRGVKALPPLKAKKPEDLNRLQSSMKGKEKLVPHSDVESDNSEYAGKLQQAYVDSYRDLDGSQESWARELEVVRHLNKDAATPRLHSPHSVKEGSLAIGPNARVNFTVQTTEEWSKGKGGKKKWRRKSEIVPTSPPSSLSTDSSFTTPTHQTPTHQPPNAHNRTQSRVCTIL